MINVQVLAATATVLALAVAGCASRGGEDASGAAAEPVAAASSPAAAEKSLEPEPTTPLEGVWRLRQTRRDVVTHLRQYGFEDIVERFVRIENVTPQDHWEWTFTGDDFVATWQNPDGSWKVADSGTFEVDGGRATLAYHGAPAGGATTFGWRRDGRRLWLTWESYVGPVFKEIPDEAYWRAYLTKPLTRVR